VAAAPHGPLLSSRDRRALGFCVIFGMIVWVVVLGLVMPRLDDGGHPTHDIPLDVANLLDAANLSSVHLGTKCVATSMQLARVVALLDGDRRWTFRWDENMVVKTGFVAAILDHHGPESYLLQFSFAATKTVGEATLVRIATAGNPDDGVASRSGEECMNAGQAGQPLTLPVLGAPSQEPRLQLLDPQRHHDADRAQHEKGHHHVRGIEGAARMDGEVAHAAD